MAVERTIQGYFLPVVGFVRFSVRKTGVFSCARPTKSTPSFSLNAARYLPVPSVGGDQPSATSSNVSLTPDAGHAFLGLNIGSASARTSFHDTFTGPVA